MKKLPTVKIKWRKKPEKHDYPAAVSYLSIIFETAVVQELVEEIKNSEVVWFKAKDIFRASGLSLLGVSNSHVEKNIKKIKRGKKLSPIILVRERALGKVIVADGYHRVCAVYHFNEDALIPCQIK